MNLVIDIGNSYSKLAVFNGPDLRQVIAVEKPDKATVQDFIKKFPEKVRHVILSAVKDYPAELDVFFNDCFSTYLRLDHQLPLPVSVQYRTPQTLGMDRLAAVVGASVQFEDRPLLVIDAGTCITFDFLDEKKVYHGGAISPGIRMRFKAMHNFTGRLPFINWNNSDELQVSLLGDSTENAMIAGVINGVRAEVRGIMEQYHSKYENLQVIMTGGDLETFDKVLKNRIFADPNLVLGGLNEILRYNLES